MAKKTIVVRGEPIVDEQHTASAGITPGNLIEISSGQFRKHATAGGAAAAIFADSRGELGKSIDTDYASGDRVKALYPAPGDKINAVVASGETISDGAELQSDGAGRLTAGTTKPVARAAEDHTLGSARLVVVVI